MYKIAVLNEKEIAREKAIKPMIGEKFNVDELDNFYNRIARTIDYDNSNSIKFYCMYVAEEENNNERL